MVTLGCDSCNYIARLAPEAAKDPWVCFNGHGPLARRYPQLESQRLAPEQSWAVREDSRIVGVAVIWGGILYTLPKPYRHCHVLSMIHELDGAIGITGEQGFIDQHGSFLTRRVARPVAVRAGQFIMYEPVLEDLYSENVW